MAGREDGLAGRNLELDEIMRIRWFLKINRGGEMTMASLATGFLALFRWFELSRQVNKGIWQVKWSLGR
ncbi:hypothetical protein V7124_01830 [Neobacillus niacini]|uniref:hypothetical protein n=1 Tax=Neobacillus niacini TaxID=86668 RepID=UPI0030000852